MSDTKVEDKTKTNWAELSEGDEDIEDTPNNNEE
jgi:hypothetical protein